MRSDDGGTKRTAHRSSGGFARLSSVALMFLRLESDAWPCHFGGLAVVEAKTLLVRSRIFAVSPRRWIHEGT
jgi:hypothetical protein